MKKNYEAPELELVLLADVITTSDTYTPDSEKNPEDNEDPY